VGGGKWWNERQVVHWFFLGIKLIVEKLEVFQVLEYSDKYMIWRRDPLGLLRARDRTAVRSDQNTAKPLE